MQRPTRRTLPTRERDMSGDADGIGRLLPSVGRVCFPRTGSSQIGVTRRFIRSPWKYGGDELRAPRAPVRERASGSA